MQVELLNEDELSKYVDVDCLPADLGGEVMFKIPRWIEYQQVSRVNCRRRVEDFSYCQILVYVF